jgi:hypothetical protein
METSLSYIDTLKKNKIKQIKISSLPTFGNSCRHSCSENWKYCKKIKHSSFTSYKYNEP